MKMNRGASVEGRKEEKAKIFGSRKGGLASFRSGGKKGGRL